MNRRSCERLAPVLEPGIAPETLCFSSEVFFYFLERELAQAERYGNYSAFVVCRLSAPDGEQQRQVVQEAVRCLGRNIRATDYLGMVDTDSAGIILQNTTVENAAIAASRLEEEVSLQLSALNGGSEFSLVFAVYPTEANTFQALKTLVTTRLGETVQ